MKTHVIIAAAGYGKRFGGKISKQLVLLKRKPVLYYCLKIFEELKSISNIIIVTNYEIIDQVKDIVLKNKFEKVGDIILGGSYRQRSIYEGLKILDLKKESIILIHDSARPFISSKLVNNIIRNSIVFGSAIPAIPVKDTIKYSEDGRVFEKTIDRNKLWAIQTPQGFKSSIILKAHQKAVDDNFIGTDDASLIERIGIKPKLIPGSDKNIKITAPIDLIFAKSIINDHNEWS